MDSDEDGNYGYDIPSDDNDGDGGGFSISNNTTTKPYHLGGNNNNNSSSDEDEDDNNFAYGSYGRNKRERNANNMSGKERNLYGVFYEDDSDDDNNDGRGGRYNVRGGGGGRNNNKRARNYDVKSNRLAGLSFVKGGEEEGGKSSDDKTS